MSGCEGRGHIYTAADPSSPGVAFAPYVPPIPFHSLTSLGRLVAGYNVTNPPEYGGHRQVLEQSLQWVDRRFVCSAATPTDGGGRTVEAAADWSGHE